MFRDHKRIPLRLLPAHMRSDPAAMEEYLNSIFGETDINLFTNQVKRN